MQKPPDNHATHIHRNTLWVAAANLLSRGSGLLREIAFAAAFGAGVAADAFNAAFRVGNLFRELFAEGALASAFVPLFADVDEKEGASSAWALANAFLGLLLAAVGLVCLLTLLFARPLVIGLAGGFATDPEKLGMAVSLTRVLSPFLATVSVASVFMGMLNVRGRFFLPSAAPICFNLFVIVACVFDEQIMQFTGAAPIYAVAVAALLGGASQALVQLPVLRTHGFHFRPRLSGHPSLVRLLKFLGPALVAISVVQINLLIETQLASREGHGPVSWLIYSFRVAHLPLSLVSVAVGVASLAGLSVLRAQGRLDEFKRALGQAINLNTFLLAPAAVGLFILAEPIIRLLFERGAFSPSDTLATASMLRMYAIALLGIGAHRVLIPVFYTLDDPKTPMWVGLGTVALKLPVALYCMRNLGFGVDGLPLSHAILVSCEIGVLLYFLERRVGGLANQLAATTGRTAISCAALAAAIWPLRLWAVGWRLVPVMALAGFVYALSAFFLGSPELRQLLGRRPPPQ